MRGRHGSNKVAQATYNAWYRLTATTVAGRSRTMIKRRRFSTVANENFPLRSSLRQRNIVPQRRFHGVGAIEAGETDRHTLFAQAIGHAHDLALQPPTARLLSTNSTSRAAVATAGASRVVTVVSGSSMGDARQVGWSWQIGSLVARHSRRPIAAAASSASTARHSAPRRPSCIRGTANRARAARCSRDRVSSSSKSRMRLAHVVERGRDPAELQTPDQTVGIEECHHRHARIQA